MPFKCQRSADIASLGEFIYRPIAMLLALIFFLSSQVQVVSAMCPLCVAGAAVGLSLARYYGLDDTVTGLWLGALVVSTALWITILIRNMMRKRKIRFIPFQDVIVFIGIAAATIVPFYSAGFFNGMTGMTDTIFGINKLVIGVVIGSIITFFGPPLSNFIKRRRKSVFPYQTILLTLGLLAAFSLLFWYLTKYIPLPA